MPDPTRYQVSLSAAQELCQKLDARPQMPRHERLAAATFLILDAIGQAAKLEREDSCCGLCPGCFRSYHLDPALRGQPITCVGCGRSSRAPEALGRN